MQFSPEAMNLIRQEVRRQLAEYRNTLPGPTRRGVIAVGKGGEILLAKTKTSVNPGFKVDVMVWTGEKGLEKETDREILDVYNRGGPLPADKFVYITKVNGGYEIVYVFCERIS